jgi:hypothetical protein
MNNKNIESSLVTTIVNSEIKDIGIDILEISLDSVLDEGVIKEIPIIGSLAKLYSVGNTIQGKIFEKKILKFLYETDKVSDDKREKFKEKIERDPSFRNLIGEKLLVIIDKTDDTDKATIIGKIFGKYIDEEIDLDVFQRLASTVVNSFLPDLRSLYKYKEKPQWRSFTSTSLENVGLTNLSYIKPEKYDTDGNKTDGSEYTITELGDLLLELNVI